MSESTRSASAAEAEPVSDAQALQEALRAEHAAVYGYGFIGAQTSGDVRERCRVFLDEHRGQRDTLRTELLSRGAKPAVSKAAYAVPDSTDDAKLRAHAAGLEEVASQAYLQLAAATDPELRDLAGRSLQNSTLRALDWGAKQSAFPGFPGGKP